MAYNQHEAPKRLPITEIAQTRDVLEKAPGSPIVYRRGKIVEGIDRILFHHGEIRVVALLRGDYGEGSTLEGHFQPGVVVTAMREGPNGPEFCLIGETRTYSSNKKGKKGETLIVLSFPQGHVRTREQQVSGIMESTGESTEEAGRRELKEEAGVETEDPGKKIGTALRDVSLSPSKVTFVLYRISDHNFTAVNQELHTLLGQELDPAEHIMPVTVQWRTLGELLKLRRTGEITEIRTLAAIGFLEDYMRKDPELRRAFLEAILYDATPEELRSVLQKKQTDDPIIP